jgi:hypothetical protein
VLESLNRRVEIRRASLLSLVTQFISFPWKKGIYHMTERPRFKSLNLEIVFESDLSDTG